MLPSEESVDKASLADAETQMLYWPQQLGKGFWSCPKETPPRPPTDSLDVWDPSGLPGTGQEELSVAPLISSWLCRHKKGLETTTEPVQDKVCLGLRSQSGLGEVLCLWVSLQPLIPCSGREGRHGVLGLF